jgi:UbiD family decarboxylase
MAFEDLRNFIDYLESRGELTRVEEEVDARYEIGAICRMALDRRAPALFFSRVKGSSIPIVTNLVASRERYAMALESTPDKLHEDWVKRVERFVEPILVEHGPCQENVLLGDDVDLGRLPVPIWNELDGGPFITYSCHISKDPDTGSRNAAMYRAQVHDRNTLGILAAPYRHIMLHRAKRPGEPLPVALALGLDPAIHIASCAPVPFGVDEIALAGAIRGKAVEMVRCKTIPLEVPARAEIVLEGEILPGVLREEGNFGEFTGFYGFVVKRPVIRIKAITFRTDPIYLATYVGKPPHEDCQLKGIPVEFEILRSVSIPGIKKVNVTEGGAGAFNCFVSIEKKFEGYGKMIAMAVLGTWGARFIKNLIIVDDDIDPFDPTAVEWALATRVQPDRDVEIIKAVTGVILDPSLPEEERATGTSRTAKLIIDATRYDAEKFEIPCLPDRETMQRVEKNWEKYGL